MADLKEQEKAYQLHLAGVPKSQISGLVGLTSDEIDDATWVRSHGRQLELDRLDKLWSTHYPKAMKGDDKSTQACLKILQQRKEVLIHWPKPPTTEVEKAEELGTTETIQTAFRILAGGTVHAARALIDVAKHGKSETARVLASAAILDRSGLGVKQDITIRSVPTDFDPSAQIDDETMDPAAIVLKRLEILRLAHETEQETIIDAELVDPVE
jgi:hypothetical protein